MSYRSVPDRSAAQRSGPQCTQWNEQVPSGNASRSFVIAERHAGVGGSVAFLEVGLVRISQRAIGGQGKGERGEGGRGGALYAT